MLPFLEKDLADSKKRKSELRIVLRKSEELFAALTLLRDVMEEAELYGATFDLQERYASLRRWMLRSPDEITRLLVEQRRAALGSMIAVSRLEPTPPADIVALVTPRELGDTVRRNQLLWRTRLDEYFHEARVVKKTRVPDHQVA